MPNSRPLDDLRKRLAAAMTIPLPLRAVKEWAHDQQMIATRKAVDDTFNGLSAAPSDASIQEAVHAFAQTKAAPSFTSIKHVCYGLTLPTGHEEPLLIQSPRVFSRLLDVVSERRAEPRQFRRCYQALLQSYFVYERPLDPDDARTKTQTIGDRGFGELRVYLRENLSLIAKPIGRNPAPDWTVALVNNKNLLSEQPCDKYISELRQGHTKTLQEVCSVLGISRSSWIWQEVVLAYVRELCERVDKTFAERMPDALDIADNKTDLRPSTAVSRRVVSALTVRYSSSESHPESPRLRDMAVEHIGNPWLKRAAWDAFVAHEPARKMVDGWLKSRLIRDFFELLSHDGAAEQRRLDYWLRFEPVIDDMWFVLGRSAQTNRSPEFRDLKRRMEGRARALSGSAQDDNNAFIIKIGKTLLIEFGVTGNACYIFDQQNFKCDLDQDPLSIYSLKQKPHSTRLSHMSAWEARFDSEICHRINFWPEGTTKSPRQRSPLFPIEAPRQPPVPEPKEPRDPTTAYLEFVLKRCERYGYEIKDHRPSGGALWIITEYPIADQLFALSIKQAKFEFKPGKGYWLKDS